MKSKKSVDSEFNNSKIEDSNEEELKQKFKIKGNYSLNTGKPLINSKDIDDTKELILFELPFDFDFSKLKNIKVKDIKASKRRKLVDKLIADFSDDQREITNKVVAVNTTTGTQYKSISQVAKVFELIDNNIETTRSSKHIIPRRLISQNHSDKNTSNRGLINEENDKQPKINGINGSSKKHKH